MTWTPRFAPCRYCESRGPCYPGCDCAKCVDPDGYEDWKRENPDEYEEWKERQREEDYA